MSGVELRVLFSQALQVPVGQLGDGERISAPPVLDLRADKGC